MDDNGPLPSWDVDNSGFDGQFDDGDAYSDVEDPNTLVSQPRQVDLNFKSSLFMIHYLLSFTRLKLKSKESLLFNANLESNFEGTGERNLVHII